jgi:hypothetical protein
MVLVVEEVVVVVVVVVVGIIEWNVGGSVR